MQIELAQEIIVRHCSLYDVPRAGINIGDGCWGGHLIEFCDVFDTVKETGDHGSFNSWGRDRFWHLDGLNLNDDAAWETQKELPVLDAVKTVIMRNNRWRCDHGWDIDLDDGSTNYHIYNNVCLNGGLKNREGFFRIVENNVLVNNGFHPHVWYKHSHDVVRRNIMWSDHYLPAGGMPSTPWGKVMDLNLVHRPGTTQPTPATKLAEQSQRDAHSIVADALFVDADGGDFRVRNGSPALAIGFVNFPMDKFGVQKPELKAIARTPELGKLNAPTTNDAPPIAKRRNFLWQAQVRDISGLGDRSAYGLPEESGVLLLNVPVDSPAAKAGLQKDDVIVACNGKAVNTIQSLQAIPELKSGKPMSLSVIRKQQSIACELNDYPFFVTEYQTVPDFKLIPLLPTNQVLSAKITAGPPGTLNDPLTALADGKLVKSYGPVFTNGKHGGMYKLDLGSSKSVLQINTFSHNQGGVRGRQWFVVFGSFAESDPGWNVDDTKLFTPIVDVDIASKPDTTFVATSIRQSSGKPIGTYRSLIWCVTPATSTAGGENTAFQELQVIEAERNVTTR